MRRRKREGGRGREEGKERSTRICTHFIFIFKKSLSGT